MEMDTIMNCVQSINKLFIFLGKSLLALASLLITIIWLTGAMICMYMSPDFRITSFTTLTKVFHIGYRWISEIIVGIEAIYGAAWIIDEIQK
jgi:hypothetical protein